jgi:hypothetical protein
VHWTSDDENEPMVIAANQLSPGDEVEIRIRGTVNELGVIRVDHTTQTKPSTYSTDYLLRQLGAKILLVRAHDHPSHDLVGAVRRTVEVDEDGRTTWVKVGRPSEYDHTDYDGIWWCIETGEEKTHDDLGETERVGSVPFTAAYRAEEKKS